MKHPQNSQYLFQGLDPALPGYNERGLHAKLDPGDAKLVDVVHTYMKILGYAQPLGHIDFYANGGRYQPGCPDIYDICKIFSQKYI